MARKIKPNMINALILNKDNHVLLIHNCKQYGEIKNNRWEFPGGKVKEEDKNLEEVVIREAEEELGIKIKRVGGKKALGDYETTTPEGKFLCRTYFAKIDEGEPKITESEKIDRFDYFSHDGLLKLNEKGILAPNLRLALPKLKEYME